MADEPPDKLARESTIPANPDPFLWLIKAIVPSDPDDEALYLTPNPTPVVFDTDASGDPITWKPKNIELGIIERQSDGSTPSITLEIGAIQGDIIPLLLQHDFLRGQRCDLQLVHKDALDDPEQSVPFETEISGGSATLKGAKLELSGENLLALLIPGIAMTPDGCQWQYGADGCFFDIDGLDPGLATLGLCPKTLVACRLRGDVEVAAGRPRLHPKQFFAFPGMTKGDLIVG